ncbi:MoaD/ThiS family protein [Moorella stamsii]|nr:MULTISPECIES: MoaD/ThiS family protein [Moorella]
MQVKLDMVAPSGLEPGKRVSLLEVAEGATVNDLIQVALGTFGARAKEMLLQPDGKTPYVTFVVNGVQVSLDYVLNPDDTVTVFPPIGGGY